MSSRAEFPEKLQFLFKPARYKVLYGGRGGAKSWGVARALLIQAATSKLRILCGREFQNSITESVHHLLEEQIAGLGLSEFYRVQKYTITGANGSEFVFAGIKQNINNLKSFEGADRVWVEEAQTVSHESWKKLIPTIRKDSSEIWVTFNPELESDETYKRFVLNPPSDAAVVKLNWSDNPWFPEVLRKEKDELKERDPDSYQNVWEGHCMTSLDGAIYAKELRLAQEEGRIRSIPYDAMKPVQTFWDLGWADNTSIWFAQSVGNELRLIDYYSNSQQPLQHYINMLQSKGYIYGTDWLPHDARAKTLATGRSIEEIMLGLGRKVSITPNLSIFDGINALRTIFNRCYFDEHKCADGIQSLRHYRYDVDPDSKQFSGRPLHDHSSHASDALRYFAVSVQEDSPQARSGRVKIGGWRT
ncbi:MAG: PBSX family phage terminase large subunit [Devosia sp.]